MSVAMSVGESDGGKAVAIWLWPCGCGHKSAWRFERVGSLGGSYVMRMRE